MENSFVVGACVYEGYICGKSKEVKVLTDCICESSNVVFHSGSGLGKTHLIKHVRHKFSRKVKGGVRGYGKAFYFSIWRNFVLSFFELLYPRSGKCGKSPTALPCEFAF